MRVLVVKREIPMKVTIVEGTPEEILAAMPHLKGSIVSAPPVADERPDPMASGQGHSYVSSRLARRVLSRRRLKPQQITVLKELYSAHPKLVLAKELQAKTSYTPAQFAGLMGAIGRRVSHTEGYMAGDTFFVQEWNDKDGCWAYGLPDGVREAMKLERLV